MQDMQDTTLSSLSVQFTKTQVRILRRLIAGERIVFTPEHRYRLGSERVRADTVRKLRASGMLGTPVRISEDRHGWYCGISEPGRLATKTTAGLGQLPQLT
jgi:hypothetical protein